MGHEPENTLASIRKALQLGAPCVEVDVHRVDGHLIVFHDELLERTTNGRGRVSECTFESLRKLDAGRYEQIPTLEEVCAELAPRSGLNIELKGSGTAAPVADFLAGFADQSWCKRSVLVSSFDHRALRLFRKRNRDIKLGASLRVLPVADCGFAQDIEAFSVHFGSDFVDRRFVDDAHARQLKVYVFTVNHSKDMERMHEWGVDGVFTDYPEQVVSRFAQPDFNGGWA
jgi:glycerophosphoryl diester phosphodiesterase